MKLSFPLFLLADANTATPRHLLDAHGERCLALFTSEAFCRAMSYATQGCTALPLADRAALAACQQSDALAQLVAIDARPHHSPSGLTFHLPLGGQLIARDELLAEFTSNHQGSARCETCPS